MIRGRPRPITTGPRPSNTLKKAELLLHRTFCVARESLRSAEARAPGACKPRAPRGPAQLVTQPAPPSHSWVSSKACLSNVQSPPPAWVPRSRFLVDLCSLPAKKGADAALLVGLLLPVPHVMGARGLPRPDASAQTLSLSWPFLPNLA